ncbi:hypothetical protein HMI54_009551 [Coelomomyces lativittatus]|nr:hypothetical protein HMI56_006299 [Coelomomyces lativittatus]KAJ1518188.1 hypothetical protein HMI55_001875 [Coelomomyces lativittatus]KAJ1518724.1 hypothetical protein HMI54_009551 [Coelomomyces lativittatus]
MALSILLSPHFFSKENDPGNELEKIKTTYEVNAKTLINSNLWEMDQLPSYLSKIKHQLSTLTPLVNSHRENALTSCQSTLHSCKLALNELENLAFQLSQSKQLHSKTQSLSKGLVPLQQFQEEYQKLEFYAHYLQLLRKWICLKKAPTSFSSFQALTELLKNVLEIVGPCTFSQHLDQSINVEKKNLIDFYKRKVEQNLIELGWPNALNQDNPNIVHSFTEAYECLYSISEQDAIHTIIDSLRVRFEFHFLSDKPTNDLFHPEWYLSFLRTPLIEHQWFILTVFQKHFPIFIKEWTNLAIRKFSLSVPSLIDHPPLLLKTLLLLSTFTCDIQSIYFLSEQRDEFSDETKEEKKSSDEEMGLHLPTPLQSTILDCLRIHMEKVVNEWMELTTIWDPIEEEFLLSQDTFLTSPALTQTASVASFKRPLLWYKFCSYDEIFVSLAKKLEPSFATSFLQKIACSTLLNCSYHVRKRFSSSSFLNSSFSSKSAPSMVSDDISFYFSLLSLYPLFLKLPSDWSFEIPTFEPNECIQKLNTTFKSLLSMLIDSVSLSLSHFFQYNLPFLPLLAHFFHHAQSAFESTSSPTYQRFFRHCLTRFDTLFLQWLTLPVQRSTLLHAYTPFHSILSQFSPFPSISLPKTQFIIHLAEMEREQADFQIQSILETGPDVFIDGFSIADYIRISQNLI